MASAAYRVSHREKIAAYAAAYYRKNRARILRRQKELWSGPEGDKRRAALRGYRRKNRDRILANEARYRLKKKLEGAAG